MILNLLIIFTAKYLWLLAAAAAILYFFKQPRQKQKELFVFALWLLPLSYLLAKTLSRFYFDPRPFVAEHFTPLVPHAPDNGFPSDHTLLGTAIAFAILNFNKKLGISLFFLAILVGVARVLAGVHRVADIIGSIVVVSAVYFFVNFYAIKLFKKYLP